MLTLVEFKRLKKISLKIFNILALAIFASVILLTQSYTSILVLLFLIGLFWFLKLPKKIKIISLLISPLILALFIFSQKDSPKFQILFGTADYSKPNSIIRRLQIYEVNEFALEQNLIKGLGAGNYQNYFLQNQNQILENPIPTEEVPPHPHNLAMNFWADLGIFGLILILIIYLWTAVNIFQKDQNLYFLVLAYPLLHGLIDTPYTLEENSLIFWILVYFALPKLTKNEI